MPEIDPDIMAEVINQAVRLAEAEKTLEQMAADLAEIKRLVRRLRGNDGPSQR